MNNLDVIELGHVDLLEVHRAALAQYERDAAECETNDEPITAQLFREAAARRRKLIERLENTQHGEEQQIESNHSSQ